VIKNILTLLLLSFAASAQAALDIQHWKTDNGAAVYFVEAHQIPMVQFAVAFDAAASRDPDGKEGLAALTNTLVDDGAGGMDEETVAERLAGVGAEYSSQSARDMAILELRVLSEESLRDPAVDVFSKIIAEPAFPGDALEREKQRTLVGIEQRRQSPRDVATKAYYASLYPDHPYGRMPEGQPESVSGIRREDLVAFHARHYVAANAVTAIVGDLTRDQAEAMADRILGGLPAGEPAAPLPEVEARESGVDVHEPFPSQQSHLLMGQAGITRDDPDYFPLYVGNHVLGGSGLISRLSVEIREERGMAYSVYSYFVPMQRPGPYILGLQTRNDQAKDAREISLETVRRFIEEGPTDEELQSAKNNITGGFPLRLDSNQDIANQVLNIAFYDLPIDYLDKYSERVGNVTRSGILDAFQRRVHPDKWVQVRVGPES